MKKNIIITLVLAVSVLTSMGQNTNKKFRVGVRAGINSTNISTSNFGVDDIDNNSKAGLHAGFYGDIQVTEKGYLQPAILFSSKGSKFLSGGQSITVSAGYIEIPINYVYKSKGNDGGFVIGGGAYIARGISGIVKERSDAYKETYIRFVKPGNTTETDTKNNYYLKPLDGGISALIGAQFKSGISFQLNGQLGLINQAIQSTSIKFTASSYKNYGFGLSLGYRF